MTRPDRQRPFDAVPSIGSMDWTRIKAVLFDLDGVITPTADVHMLAWREMFTGFLTSRGESRPYTDADYFDHIDGKPRYDGVRDFLASRGISLPEGDPDDDPAAETVCGLGNRKNATFNEIIARDGVRAYPGSLALLADLERQGVPAAVVSSSKNAVAVLRAAGLGERFGVIVDGRLAHNEGLSGKPAPDTYLRAAELLGVPRESCMVVEDAVSGIQAGRAGGFAMVLGVDRGAGVDALTGAGADLVVSDLEDVRP